MGKECRSCVFNTNSEKCEILTERIEKNCFAWADEKELERRNADMKKYEAYCYGEVAPKRKLSKEVIEKRQNAREANAKKRGGKTIRELLDENYLKLYKQGMSDQEIAEQLGMQVKYVGSYRKDLFLKPNKKYRSAGTEAAKENQITG